MTFQGSEIKLLRNVSSYARIDHKWNNIIKELHIFEVTL